MYILIKQRYLDLKTQIPLGVFKYVFYIHMYMAFIKYKDMYLEIFACFYVWELQNLCVYI